jgi:putative Mn2+ efflux pump MntP
MFIILMMPLMLLAQEVSNEYNSIFLSEFFNNVPIDTYKAGAIFILFGIIVSWYIKSKKAQKTNPNTPTTFSWKLFFLTKIPRKITSIIVGIIVGFVAMRFVTDILGLPLTMFICFVIGVTFDNIIVKISKLQLPLK